MQGLRTRTYFESDKAIICSPTLNNVSSNDVRYSDIQYAQRDLEHAGR